jgi:hypothetical protein
MIARVTRPRNRAALVTDAYNLPRQAFFSHTAKARVYKVLTLGGDELRKSVRKVFHGKDTHGVSDRPREYLQ